MIGIKSAVTNAMGQPFSGMTRRSHGSHRSPAANAFSLIELLVVISIIAVLASMLMQGLATVRSSARTSVCLSHLRQIGGAISTYSTDNEGQIMLGSYLDGSIWSDRVLEQLDVDASSGILRCPAASVRLGDRHYGAQFNLFAMGSRIPVPPATTVGGWRAKVGTTREMRSDGILVLDVSQDPTSGNCKTLPTEIGIMWNWFNRGSADDMTTITTPANVDTSAWSLDRYRHGGNGSANFLWGDLHVSTQAYASMVKGNFRCSKNGRKQSWEPN